jgi:hypothetical protein
MKKVTFERNDIVSKDDSSAVVSEEHDIKMAILKELEVSIQMASSDFVLIPPLKRFSVDDDHCVFDLLFYHRDMHCLIAVYLKFGDLHIDDIERMKFSLQILEQYKAQYDDKKDIGLILCVQDNGEHVELVRQEPSKGWFSKNFIDLPLRQIFRLTLRDTVRQARKQHEHGNVSTLEGE